MNFAESQTIMAGKCSGCKAICGKHGGGRQPKCSLHCDRDGCQRMKEPNRALQPRRVPAPASLTVEPDPTTRAALERIAEDWTERLGRHCSPELVGRNLLANAVHDEYLHLTPSRKHS